MKKRRILALGLLFGIISSQNTQAYDNGIYSGVDEYGNEVKTVIWSGIQLTIKMENQPGIYYYWGFNENTVNSVFDDYSKPGTGTYMSGDGKIHGGTFGINDAWGGENDSYNNGFTPNVTNGEARQGPCDTGYHVPSRGEWNALVIAWCNIYTGCNARYSDIQVEGVAGDLHKITGSYARTENNKLIYINTGLGAAFKNTFNIASSDHIFWSSSPYTDDVIGAWSLRAEESYIYPNYGGNRYYDNLVRCFKNSIFEQSVLKNESPTNKGDMEQNKTEGFSEEFQQAYEFAHENGITTMPTIQEADMDGKLTRIAMAKMLSQYAINVLGKTPDTTQNNKFNDVTEKMDSDYDNGVTLAYQLGIMGQNMPNNRFRPNDEVTRAEFATALSRMIYGTSDGEYKGTGKYYIHHMEKLVEEGIITKDDPRMKELRGYVMIMLMRSAK